MTPTAPGIANPPPRGRNSTAGPATTSSPPARRGEAALCAALSAALHLGALAAFAMIAPTGAPSGGSGGAVSVTLVAPEAAPASRPAAPSARLAPAPPDPAPPSNRPEQIAHPTPRAPDPEPAVLSSLSATPSKSAAPRPRPPDLPTPRAAPADPRTDPAPPADARPSVQQASGAGGAEAAGVRGPAASATGDTAAPPAALQAWTAQIQRALQRDLRAPRGLDRAARDLRLVLALSVAPDGRLRRAEIATSSGDATIDAAALRALGRIGRLPRAPDGLTNAAYSFHAPVDLQAR